MRCPSCGKEIPDGSRFCSFCGVVIPEKQTIPDVFDDPAHQTTYTGAFSQPVSGGSGSTINMKGGMGSAQPAMDPKKLYKSTIISMSIAIVFATIGLILGILASDPANKDGSFLVAFGAACGFFGLFGFLIFWIQAQIKIAKAKPYDGFVNWIPAILALVDLGISIPAVIFAVQGFIAMVS